MTRTPFTPKIFSSLNLVPLDALVLGCFVMLAGGCSVKRRPSIPWNAAILVRPTNPPRSRTPAGLHEDPVPDLQPEMPPFPLRLISTKSPPRPHVTAPAAGGGADSEKLDALM